MKFFVQTLLLIIPILSYGQWETKFLSESKSKVEAVVFDNKMLIVGGAGGFGSASKTDTYDFATGEFTSENAEDRDGRDYVSVTLEDLAIFGKGNLGSTGEVSVYYNDNKSWETFEIVDPRIDYELAAYGDEAFFFGGTVNSDFSNQIDIYNVKTKQWRKDNIPGSPKINRTAYQIGNKFFLIGGFEGDNTATAPLSSTVDVYDLESGVWESFELTEARSNMAVTHGGGNLIIAGGMNTNSIFSRTTTVDIIDLDTYNVSTTDMPGPNAECHAFYVANKVMVIGGRRDQAYAYDFNNQTWTEEELAVNVSAFQEIDGAVLGHKVYIAGSTQIKDKIFIYDGESNTWSFYITPEPRFEIEVEVIGNQILFLGGKVSVFSSSDAVDIFTDTTIIVRTPLSLSINSTNVDCHGASTATITAAASGGGGSFEYYLNNDFDQRNTTGIFENLPAGTYDVNVLDADMHVTTQTVVITQPDPLNFNTDVTQPTSMQNDGSICITDITGGVSPFIFLFQTPVTGNCIENLAPGDYVVTVMDANGCEFSLTITLTGSSGTSGIEFDPNLVVFPNPSKIGFFIESEQTLSKASIIDLNGKTLFVKNIDSKRTFFSRENFASGNYFLLIENDNGEKQIEHIVFE